MRPERNPTWLAESPSGKWLYSVPWLGGKNGVGTVIAVKKNGSASRVLLDLDSTTGGKSTAGAAMSASGKYMILGMTAGARYNIGSIVSFPIPPSVR